MPLLQDGTVVRRFPHLSNRDPTDNAVGEELPSHEAAPIEDVTKVVEGLNTTITFTFKAVEGEKLRPSRHSNAGSLILCAEDNRVHQSVLGKIMDKYGQDFVMTGNGQQAVEVYKSSPERFPCILMDLAMPVMDGREATSLIRAFESTRPGHRRALIVGLMAYYNDPVDASMFSASGFDLLMSKPLWMEEMYEMFLGGPETNIVMLYGGLTEEEKSVYPRLVDDAVLGDDPRSNAIKNELRQQGSRRFTKIVVKVVEAGKGEQCSKIEN